jgi:hypothetical protein
MTAQWNMAMTSQYDPLEEPDPEEWLSLDEGERLLLVEDYHRRARVCLPNIKVHAAMHVVVETQIALGDEIPVPRMALRLLDEGLDRHEAIHAIASVLAGHMFDLTRTPQRDSDAALSGLFCCARRAYSRKLAATSLTHRRQSLRARRAWTSCGVPRTRDRVAAA